MALLNGQNVCDEVAWRIQNRIAASSTGAGSLISMTNDALSLISSAGSWVWDTTSITNATALQCAPFVVPIDLGKKITVLNSLTSTPIVKITQDDNEAAGAGYANVTGTEYNVFRTYSDSVTGNGGLLFYPNAVGGNIDVFYHQLPPVLVYGAFPTVRWTVSQMDALLKDWTTAIAMKWLGMTGWDTNWADCLQRVGTLNRMYTTERINTGPEAETTAAVGEKNALGRS